jgi:phosphatidylethanolamine-binding protein (PEBP) family uncharacterized protein
MSLQEVFINNGIVPDILDEAPKNVVEVKYDSGVNLSAASVLTPTQVKNEPAISFEADSQSFYTLLMTDPDAPTKSVII